MEPLKTLHVFAKIRHHTLTNEDELLGEYGTSSVYKTVLARDAEDPDLEDPDDKPFSCGEG